MSAYHGQPSEDLQMGWSWRGCSFSRIVAVKAVGRTMTDWIPILGGGLTGAVLTQGAVFLREWWNETKDAKVSAMFLSAELDAYASSCVAVRQDVSNFESSGGEIGQAWRRVPELPEYPDKTNWRALGVNLSQRVLAFRSRVVSRNVELDALWELMDMDDVVALASDQSVKIGAQAVAQAVALRAAYRIKPVIDEDEFDVPTFLERELKDIQAKAKVAEARQAKRDAERAALKVAEAQ